MGNGAEQLGKWEKIMAFVIILVVVIIAFSIIKVAMSTRCPKCRRIFAIEKYAGGDEVKTFTRNRLGIQSGFIGTDLKVKGFAVGNKTEKRKVLRKTNK